MAFRYYLPLLFFTLVFHVVEGQSPQSQNRYGQNFELRNITPVENLSETEGKLTISSTVQTTCAMKGCWMKIDDGQGGSIRVTFKDYGFFVPTSGMEGKPTVITGELSTNTVSVEELKHFAKDAGKSDDEVALITSPKEELTFVATGVVFR